MTSFEPNGAVPSTDTAAGFVAKFDANGAESKYSFEYAPAEVGGGRPSEGSASWKPFTSGASGTIGVVEEYAWAQAGLAGLKPETTYYVRVGASNTAGESRTDQVQSSWKWESFTTLTAKPGTNGANVRNVTGDSAYVHTNVRPHGSETAWSLEYTTEPGNGGSWRVFRWFGHGFAGAGGSDALWRCRFSVPEGVRLTGLSARVRIRAGDRDESCVEGCGGVTSEAVSFTTSGAPSASVFGAHGLVGGSLRLLGSVVRIVCRRPRNRLCLLQALPPAVRLGLRLVLRALVALTATLSSGTPTLSAIPVAPVRGPGNVLHPSECESHAFAECFLVTGVSASVGRFRAGQAISGAGILPGTHIDEVVPPGTHTISGARITEVGSTLVLSGVTSAAVSGAVLLSGALSPFVCG